MTPRNPITAQNPPAHRASGGATREPTTTTTTAQTAVPGSHMALSPLKLRSDALKHRGELSGGDAEVEPETVNSLGLRVVQCLELIEALKN